MKRYLIVGGAGFIGSHLAGAIFKEEKDTRVIVYDNFSSGRIWHLEESKDNKNLEIIKGDVKDMDSLIKASKGIDTVYHFASNPDISKAATEPEIDFWEGTYLTNNILEAMRVNDVTNLLYASGSGVYGEAGEKEISEDYSPQLPISTYGASKLACESLICSYCHMFGMNAAAFRFGNVVGPHQTHGVAFDFIRKLMQNTHELPILGDGSQSKSYVYVDDVISAMRLLERKSMHNFSYYNVATQDYLTVKEIADMVLETMNLKNVTYNFSGGNRGWKGDVPVVRLNSDKIRRLGWENKYTSKEAMLFSIRSIYEDAKLNRFGWRQD